MLNPLLKCVRADPTAFVQYHDPAIGSIGNTHYFQLFMLDGPTGNSAQFEATQAPSFTQTTQYFPLWSARTTAFGYGATDLQDNYEWRITSISNMSGLTGTVKSSSSTAALVANTWYAFSPPTGLGEGATGTLSYFGGANGSYSLQLREKASGLITTSTFVIEG